MTTKFNTIDALRAKFTDAQILAMCEKFLDNREAQREYHAKYNARKTAQLAYIKANHPELLAGVDA